MEIQEQDSKKESSIERLSRRFFGEGNRDFENVSNKASERGKVAMESAKEDTATVSEKVKEASHDTKKWDDVAGEVSQKSKDAKENWS